MNHSIDWQLEGKREKLGKRSINTSLFHDDTNVSGMRQLLEDLPAVAAGNFGD